MENCSVVDLFCGAGALTHGFVLEKFNVVAGVDADKSCRYAYETNNGGARFIERNIEDMTAEEIAQLYEEGQIKILIGCAPCQPYSPYNKRKRDKTSLWLLLSKFANLICDVKPEIVSMENVPELVTFRGEKVYNDFLDQLKKDYHVTAYPEVYCPDYGIPQHRKRLVLFASKYSEIKLLPPTHTPEKYKTVRDVIYGLEELDAGQTSKTDPLHKASRLSALNLRRIRASVPGGTWRDWPNELVAKCHRKKSGDGYVSVYGRMKWDEPSPTITTQCYGFGNGRFGHPEKDRAISLREAALLQTFPEYYQFVSPSDPHYIKVIGRFIGNAVPVELARVIAKSIKRHLEAHLLR